MMKTVSLAAGVAVAGDIAAGETVFKKCMTCHSKLGETAQNMLGPILNGLKGRKSGSVPGYSYSDANKNSGIVWDEGTFKEYIKDPKAKIPGTKMVFPGIKDEKEAEDLWSFLEQFGPDGKKKSAIQLSLLKIRFGLGIGWYPAVRIKICRPICCAAVWISSEVAYR